MEIVDAPHPRGARERRLDLGHVEVGRHALEQHVDRLLEQREGARQDQQPDGGARQRVRRVQPVTRITAPPRSPPPRRARRPAPRGRRPRTFRLSPAPACSSQAASRFDAERRHRDHQDWARPAPRGAPRGAPSLDQDDDGQHAQDDAVDQRGQDLDAVVAVGLLGGGGPLREPDREQAQEARRPRRRSMWAASARSERLPAHRPTPASTTRKPAVSPNTAQEPVLVAGAVGVAMVRVHGRPLSGSRARPAGLALADALALEEPGVASRA